MSPSLVPLSFRDVDEFSAWEVELGWDIESTQLTAGANEIGFDHITFPGFLVAHFHARQSMQNLFAVPAGVVVLVLTRSTRPLFWCGAEMPATRMGIAHAGHDHWVVLLASAIDRLSAAESSVLTPKDGDVVLPADWDCYEFMIDEALLRRSEIIPPDSLDRVLRSTCPSLPVRTAGMRALLHHLDRLFGEARASNGTPLGPERMLDHHERLLHGLQRVFDEGLAARGDPMPRPTRRPDLVRQARDYLTARASEPVSIEAVAQDLGVSYRALNYAFQDALGVSPYRYHLMERLHAARRALQARNATVTEACMRHGFSTPSRFARHYRRLFGELPSATLGNGR